MSCFHCRWNSINVCSFYSLGSLLVIFLVECECIVISYMLRIIIVLIDISTSYVEYLQSKPSAPPSLTASVQPSRPPSAKPLPRSLSYDSVLGSNISGQPQKTISTNSEFATTLNRGLAFPTETSPLLQHNQPITDASFPRQLRRGVSASNVYPTAKSLHSRDHSPHRCHHHLPIIPPATVTGVPIDVLTNSPRIFRLLGMSHSHSHEHVEHEQTTQGEYADTNYHHDEHEHLRVSRRRQVVGLLVSVLTSIEFFSYSFFPRQVLQLGIMIHSLVIGLTLAIADGSDFSMCILQLS